MADDERLTSKEFVRSRLSEEDLAQLRECLGEDEESTIEENGCYD